MNHLISDSKTHYILFTGHMIDKANRPEPRFPADKETSARKAIREVIEQEKKLIAGPLYGLAGGACGGDILFHEVCEEMAIPTALYLALPKEKFIEASVEFAGQHWVKRFNDLYQKLPSYILSSPGETPGWPEDNAAHSVWERVNEWMLHQALLNGGRRLTLVALWDGKGGDGPGGTAHLVRQAQEKGAKTVIIDVKQLK